MFVYKNGFVVSNTLKMWEREVDNFIIMIAQDAEAQTTLKNWFNQEGNTLFIDAQIQCYQGFEQINTFAPMNQTLMSLIKSSGFEALTRNFLEKFGTPSTDTLIKHGFKSLAHECLHQQAYRLFNPLETEVMCLLNEHRLIHGNLSEQDTLAFVQQHFEQIIQSITESSQLFIASSPDEKIKVSQSGLFKYAPTPCNSPTVPANKAKSTELS